LAGAAQPNEYESVAQLLYKPGVRETNPDDKLYGIETEDKRRGGAPTLADEIMLLRSPRIYQEVAQELTPSYVLAPADPEAYDSAKTSWPVRTMHRLQKALIDLQGGNAPVNDASPQALNAAWRHLKWHTTVVNPRGSELLRVSYRAYSAECAQRICAELVDAFQQRHMEVFSAKDKLVAQRIRVQEAQQGWEAADKIYQDYRGYCDVWDFNAESESNRVSIELIETQLREKEGEQESLAAQIATYEEKMAQLDKHVEERRDATMTPNPRYTQLTNQLASLELELLLLVEGTVAQSTLERKREALNTQIAKVQEELEKTPDRLEMIPASVTQVPNEQYLKLEGELVQLQSEHDGLVAELENLNERHGHLVDRRKVILECRAGHETHSNTVEQARRDLDLQREALSTLEKLHVQEMSGAQSLTLWGDPPNLPLTKVGPNRFKPLLAGFAAGCAAAIGLAVLRQLLDRRLRYPETIERNLGVRILGVVPEVRRLRNFPKGTHAA